MEAAGQVAPSPLQPGMGARAVKPTLFVENLKHNY
jgi:hypothetical protein